MHLPTLIGRAVALVALAVTALGVAVLPGSPAAAAPSCTITWIGGSGSWHDPNRWLRIPSGDPGVPNTGDVACVTASGTYTVTAASIVSGPSWLVLGGSSGTQTLAVTTAAGVGGGSIEIGPRAVVSLAVDGATLGVGNGGQFTNAGTIEAVGAGTGARTIGINNTTLDNTGTIRAAAPLGLDGGRLDNDGTVAATAVVQSDQGTVDNRGGTVTLTGAGRLDLIFGRLVVGASGVAGPVRAIASTVEIAGAGPLSVAGRATVTVVGDVRAGQSISVANDAFYGTGALAADDSLVNQGTITLLDPSTSLRPGPGATDAVTNRGTIAVPGAAAGRHVDGTFVNDTAGRIDADGPLALAPGNGRTTTNRGIVDATAAVSMIGGTHVLAGGTVALSGAGTLGVAATLRLAGGAVTGGPAAVSSGAVEHGGAAAATVQATGPITVSGTVAPAQTLLVGSYHATTPSGQTFTNQGTVRLTGAGGLGNPAGTVVNGGTVERTGTAGSPELQGRWTNTGTVRFTAGTATYRAEPGFGTFTNAGTVDLAAGSRLWVAGLVQTATGRIVSRITAPTTLGAVTVDGPAHLAGEVRTVTSGTPPAGTTVVPIGFTGRTGTVAVANGGGVGWTAAHSATAVTLTATTSTPNQSFVKAAHQDFLGRPPTAGELASIAAALDAGTRGRGTVVRDLSTSPEYVTALVQRLYQDTLGRPGDSGGAAYWVGELRSGRQSVAQVAAGFYASPEYFAGIGGGTPTTWVQDLYGTLLGRAGGASEVTYWVGETAARGRTDVAGRFYQSIESRRTRVSRLYQALLGRAPDADGRAYWAGRILAEGDLALAANLAASTEYATRARIRYP